MHLTQQTPSEANSAYFDTVVPVSKFTSDFDFQLSKGNGEGFTFVLQSEGLNAIGAAGVAWGTDRACLMGQAREYSTALR